MCITDHNTFVRIYKLVVYSIYIEFLLFSFKLQMKTEITVTLQVQFHLFI